MKKILLVCNAGMSTSMLVLKMEKAAQDKGNWNGSKGSPSNRCRKRTQWLGCHYVRSNNFVRHMEKRLRELTSTPIEVINMRDYGMMNGEKVLDAALKILG